MGQLTALKELAEKVEAGTLSDELSPHYARRGLWSNSAFQLDERKLAFRAYNGSLDAAHSLHKAVLGDWWWLIEYEDLTSEVSLYSPDSRSTIIDVDNFAGSPARAWLLAIIKAKIAELED